MDFLQKIFFELPLIASFLGGILNFLAPCILPLIPSYMSYISGSVLHDETRYSRFSMFRNAMLFVFGFGLVFFLLFLAMFQIIDNFFNYPIVRYISGGIVILFGIHFLGIFHIAMLNQTKQLNLQKLEQHKILRFIAPFIIGVGFAAGWSPCSGPIISSIALLASMNEGLAIYASLAFIAGLSLPFLLLALFLDKGLNLIRKAKKQMQIIEKICGVFLIGIGILIILGDTSLFMNY